MKKRKNKIILLIVNLVLILILSIFVNATSFSWTVNGVATEVWAEEATINVANPTCRAGVASYCLTGDKACSVYEYDGCVIVISGIIGDHDDHYTTLNYPCNYQFRDGRHARPILNVRCSNNIQAERTAQDSGTGTVTLGEGKKTIAPFSAEPQPQKGGGITNLTFILTDDQNTVLTYFSDTLSNTTTNPSASIIACTDSNTNKTCDFDENICGVGYEAAYERHFYTDGDANSFVCECGEPGTQETCDLGETGCWVETTSECCGDDVNESYNHRRGEIIDINDSACCNSDTDCVYNSTCYEEGAPYELDGEIRYCENGEWGVALKEKCDWNNENCDYCAGDTQCITPQKQCVDDKEVIEGHLCDNGVWITTTKLTVLQLLDIADQTSPDDYTLFCDSYENTLNYYRYQVFEISVIQHLSEVDNLCVLNLPNQVIFGASLNKPIKEGRFIETLIDIDNCDDAATKDDGNFHQCDSGNSKAWYNNKTQSVIYSNKDILTNPPKFEINAWEAFLTFLKNPFQKIFNFLFDLFEQESIDPKDYEFINSTKEFSRIYLNRKNVRSIKGISEEIKEPQKGEYISVTYEGYNNNVCSTVDLVYDKFRRRGQFGRKDLAICHYDAGNYYVATNSSVGIALWTELTARLRPQYIYPYITAQKTAIIDQPIAFGAETKGDNPPYSYSWDFDNSDGIQPDSTEKNPTHTYTNLGDYTVTLTVQDGDEIIKTATAKIHIILCEVIDNDNDGYSSFDSCAGSKDDCDDFNASINPGSIEVCDGIDNNCDGTTDEGCPEICDNNIDDDQDTLIDCADSDCPEGIYCDTAHTKICQDSNCLPIPPDLLDIYVDWVKTIGSSDTMALASDVFVDGNDNIYYAGAFRNNDFNPVDFNPDEGVDLKSFKGDWPVNTYISKLNSDGSYAWTKTIEPSFGDAHNPTVWNLFVDDSDNVYYSGAFKGANVNFNPNEDEPADIKSSTDSAYEDGFISKLNADGSYAWTKTIGGWAGYDRISAVAVDSSGNIYYAGRFNQQTRLGPIVIPIDLNPDEGVELFDEGTGSGTTAGFITKLNSDGSYAWTKVLPGLSGGINTLVIDNNDNIYYGGSFMYDKTDYDWNPDEGVDKVSYNLWIIPAGDNINGFLSKLNSDGSYEWTKIVRGAVGELFVFDSGEMYISNGEGVSKLRVDGDWKYTAPSVDPDAWYKYIEAPLGADLKWINSFFVDGSGNMHIGGSFEKDDGDKDAFISKLYSDGDNAWTKIFGDSIRDYVESVMGLAMDSSDNLYCVGWFPGTVDFGPNISGSHVVKTALGQNDIYIAKLFEALKTEECEVRMGDCGSYTCVLSLSGGSDAHATVACNSNFNYNLCCPTIYELDSSCNEGKVISLSDEVDAHAAAYGQGSFTNDICVKSAIGGKTASCRYTTGDCVSDETCFVSLSDTNDAHLSSCESQFGVKICCKIS